MLVAAAAGISGCGDHCNRRSYRPRQQPKKNTALAALVAFRENCASDKAAIVGVIMHGLDTVAPVLGARFNGSVTAQLALVMLPLAFNIEKCYHTSTLNPFVG